MLEPRTVNDECGPGASTAAYAATGRDTSARPTASKSFFLIRLTLVMCGAITSRALAILHTLRDVRVVSLVPSATEIIAALGLADNLVGRSHECNYPPEVQAVPVVSASRIDTSQMPSATIDRAVREALADGRPLYAVDAELLERLAPDVIVTQDLCEVCAVSSGEVKRVSHIDVETISLDPRDLEEIEESIRTLARHLGVAVRGEQLAQAMHHRIDFVHQLVRGLPRQRVFVAEWLDPPFAAGHWVPEMVDLAGGDEVLGRPRERSYETTWERRGGGGSATRRARAVRVRSRAHRQRGRRRSGPERPRGRRRRRRGLLPAGPARGRGRRPARAPSAPRRRRGACLAVARDRARPSSFLPCSGGDGPCSRQSVRPCRRRRATHHGSLRARRPHRGAPPRRFAATGRRVLVIGAIHGNEPAGIAIVRRLERDGPVPPRAPLGHRRPESRRRPRGHARQRARRRPQPQLPLALASRRRAGHDRTTQGTGPLSEPESRFARRVILRLRPDITIWFHQYRDRRRQLERQHGDRGPLRRPRRAASASPLSLSPAARRRGRPIASRRPRRSWSSCRRALCKARATRAYARAVLALARSR